VWLPGSDSNYGSGLAITRLGSRIGLRPLSSSVASQRRIRFPGSYTAISRRGLRLDTATFEIRVVPTSCFVNAIFTVPKRKQHTSHVFGTMWSKRNSVALPPVVSWPIMRKRQMRAVIRRVDAPTIRTDWFSDAKEAREQLAAVLPFPEEFLVRWENREVEIEEASA
jgi:hypothetical protein